MIEVTIKHSKGEDVPAEHIAKIISQAIEFELGGKVPIVGWTKERNKVATQGRMAVRRSNPNVRVKVDHA